MQPVFTGGMAFQTALCGTLEENTEFLCIFPHTHHL